VGGFCFGFGFVVIDEVILPTLVAFCIASRSLMIIDAMTRWCVRDKLLSTPSTKVAEPDSKSPAPSGNKDGTSERVNHDVISPLGFMKRWYCAGKYAPKIGRSNNLAATRSLGQDPAQPPAQKERVSATPSQFRKTLEVSLLMR